MKLITLLITTALLFSAAPCATAANVGEPAPNFSLTAHDGKAISLDQYKDEVVVLEWFNMGCPFVQKHYKDKDMQKLQSEYKEKGVVWLTINSTHAGHGDFIPLKQLPKLISDHKIDSTALLLDAEGKVGKQYGVKTTPHMFVIDRNGNLVYQGAIDDNPSVFADPKSSKNYVRLVLDEVLAGKPVSVAKTKSYGCSVKYAN